MRLPVRPAPVPPKVAPNAGNTRKQSKPPLQRRVTNVGIEWADPWKENDPNQNTSSICHSFSAIQLNGDQQNDQRKKRTPPPRPPPPRFTQTNKNQHSRGPTRVNHKPGTSGLLSALFNSRRPVRKTQKEFENKQSHNGKPHRHLEASRPSDNYIIWETCPTNQRQNQCSGRKSNLGGTTKKSDTVNNVVMSSKIKSAPCRAESPPPLLDLLTSSPPSSPVPSSRFGGSTGADTDSLSSDGFSKVGSGNFTSAFPSDDDPFDPFGDRINGGLSSIDPWGGEDPFSPSPTPRIENSMNSFEVPWIANSRNSQPDVYSHNQVAEVKTNSISTMVTSSSFTFGEQEGWPLPAIRSTTSSPIGNTNHSSSLSNSSSNRNESLSVSNPNIRNLTSMNDAMSTRTTLQCEVPRTMNLAILGAMPTIIRAKPKAKERSRLERDGSIDATAGTSPPMPSVPPPPPPPSNFLDDWAENGEVECPPELPPRPWKEEQDVLNRENGPNGVSLVTREQPHGIALYDYPATHDDDLPFQAGDIILLIRKINDDWYYGKRESGGSPGMFPSTFVRPVMDLPNEKEDNCLNIRSTECEGAGVGWTQHLMVDNRMVRALYAFKPEVSEDLEFEEGDEIEVTAQIDSEWLWGRLGSNWGQFPASFVDHVPRGLPQHHP